MIINKIKDQLLNNKKIKLGIFFKVLGYKLLSLDIISKIIIISFFILIILLNLNSKVQNNVNFLKSLDVHWNYSIKHLVFQDQILGKDIFFTYGPLSPYLLSPSPIVSKSFLLNILPEIFIICLSLMIFYLLYKITNFNFKSLILLVPLFTLIRFNYYPILFAILLILLFLIIGVNKKVVPLNKTNIIVAAFFSSLFLLLKFNLGFTSMGVVFLLLIFSNKKNKSSYFFDLFLFILALSFFTIILFYLTTDSFNMAPFINNSFFITKYYPEYMSHSTQGGLLNILNFILLLGYFFGLFFLQKRYYLPYLFLCYTVFLYEWVRNDKGHVIIPLFFILVIIYFFIYNILTEKYIIKFISVKKISIGFIFAVLLILVLYIRLSLLPMSLLGKFNYSFFKTPFWKIENGYEKTEESLNKLNSAIPISMRSAIKKENKCLMAIPNFSAIPLALDICQVHLFNLQLYSSYTENSDKENINILKNSYPNVKIIIDNTRIDNRIYLSESPLFLRSILKNFEIELFEKKYLLLKPSSNIWKDVSCVKSDSFNSNFAKINFNDSMYSKFEKVFFKGPEVCIKTDDSLNRTYKTQLSRGIITKPYINNTSDLYNYLDNKKQKDIGKFEILYCKNDNIIETENEYFMCE